MMILMSLLALIDTASPSSYSNATTYCLTNQWECRGACIHKRFRCDGEEGACHPQFPLACNDGRRCHAEADSCWDRACIHEDCLKLSVDPGNIQRVTERYYINYTVVIRITSYALSYRRGCFTVSKIGHSLI